MSIIDGIDSPKKDRFIDRVTSGQVGLAKAFWLYAFLSNILLLIPMVFIHEYSVVSGEIWPTVLFGFVILWWRYLTFVGVWRACNSYQGNSMLRITAKTFVVIGIVHIFAQIMQLVGLIPYM